MLDPSLARLDCIICARRRGERPEEEPLGGYLHEDEHWYAYHAPAERSVPGQIFVVSQRHFLDFAEMTTEEAASYGLILRRLTTAIKRAVQAERVYALVTLEGIPHFHVWLIPRGPDVLERGWAFVAKDRSCSETEALDATSRIRRELAENQE